MTYTAYDLHTAAQQASAVGLYDLAYHLWVEAAEQAYTPAGRVVLLEKAFDAAVKADARADLPTRMH